MESLSKNTGLIMGVLLITIVFVIYNLFFKSDGAAIPISDQASVISTNALSTLNNLRQVNFDQSLLVSNTYLLLNDFSTEIPPQTTGRRNPFNVIGR